MPRAMENGVRADAAEAVVDGSFFRIPVSIQEKMVAEERIFTGCYSDSPESDVCQPDTAPRTKLEPGVVYDLRTGRPRN